MKRPARRPASGGVTLIEVLISIVILAMAVMMIYSAATATARVQAELSNPEEIANSIAGLNDVLRNYVSADPSPATAVDFAPSGSWALPGDACDWALRVGCLHAADSFLSPWIKDRHPNATLRYSVAAPAVADDPMIVTYSVQWP
jgi:prepilin-type N-terminal cleavage/methylation domain-containing protein